MAGQVGKLTLEAVIEGFEDVQGLGKALKDVSEKAKVTDKSFQGITERIKTFGKATIKTNQGLRGQIAAFERLRNRTEFQGKAYRGLTDEITNLNRQLRERLGLEKELDSATPRRRGGSLSPGSGGDKGLLSSRLSQNWGTGGTEQFASRMASLQALLVTRTFDNITEQQRKFLTEFRTSMDGTYSMRDLRGSSDAFKKIITESNAKFLEMEARLGKGKGRHTFDQSQLVNQGKLNQIQKEALNVQDDLNITSARYLEVLTKINAETGVQARLLGSRDAHASAKTALARANVITSADAVAKQQSRARSFLYSKDRALYGSQVGPTGMADSTHFGIRGMGPATREFQAKMKGAQWFHQMVGWMVPEWRSPTLKAALAEQADQKRPYVRGFRKDRTDVAAKFPTFDSWRGISGELPKGQAYGKLVRGQMGEVVQTIKDPMGLGLDPKYPRTEFGLGKELENLKEMLPHLENGTKPWLAITEKIEGKQKEINKLIKEGTKAVEARKKKIAEIVNPKVNQKLLPPARSLGDKNRYNVMSQTGVFDTGFTADQYGPQLETQSQLTKRLQETLKARDLNINSIVKHKSKLEEIRNTLKPTSEAFRSVSKSILEADKALSRINSNKFSGANLRRTGQSILGAGFVGGPAGFLGATAGAGFEALRPGGDMAGGAITGGLVASQVLTPVSQAIGGSTEYASQIEKANIALRGITKTTENYEVAQAAITKAVEVYNVPQEVAIKGMTRLSAAVLGAGGNIHNATEAFLNTTVAIKGTAGSAEDVKSAITAMVQIFSKGKVSAEELSGQLGERFPAAVTKFAKANNISTQQLQKNLKDGTVGLDMLSKFITSLGKEYEPLARKIAESNEEAGARSQIAMNKMKIAVGNALRPIGADFQIIGAQLLTDLIPAIEALALIAASVFKPMADLVGVLANNFELLTIATTLTAGAFAGLAVGKLVVGFNALSVAIGRATASHKAFNVVVAANKYVIVGTAIAGLTYGLMQLGKKYKQTAKDIQTNLFGQSIEKTRAEINKFEEDLAVWQSRKENGHWWYGEDTVNKEIELIKKQIKAREDFIEAEKKLNKAANKAKFPKLEKQFGENSPFVKFAEELEKFDESLQKVVVGGFTKLEDAILNFVKTGKLAVKDLVRSILADFAKLMIRQTVTKPLWNILQNALTGGLGGGAADPTFGTNIPSGADLKPGSFGISTITRSAMGNTFARNGIVPYSKGGVIRKPTLSLMGEQGAEAILPLQRGRGGRLGVAMQGGGGGATTVNYTGPTLNYNGDEYVPKSAVGGIINSAANKGAAMGESRTIRSLQNSRSSRSRIGI